MLTKIEKKLMLRVGKLCGDKNKALLPFLPISELFKKKNGEIDENFMNASFLSLFKHDLLDAIISNGKKEKYVYVEIKKKGQNFSGDLKREKKRVALIVLKTIALAALSFLVSILLKLLF